MRRRSKLTVVGAVLIAASVATVGLVVTPSVSQAVKPPKPPKPYYLSLGDSYSVGYQPGLGATAGYTSYVAKKAKMTLENFGCGGATTGSILTAIGCTESGYGPPALIDPVAYPTTTQEQAAVDFIAAPANYGLVGMITVSIGGNDVTACASAANPITCVVGVQTTIQTNVTSLVTTLDSALTANGDSSAKIVGLTYPDVILGDYVYPSGSPNVTLANESVVAFDALINPTLKTAYTSVAGGSFVNVTQAPYKKATSGDDTALTTTAKLSPYGTIPAAVWEICKLTYYCSVGNIHANTKGYTFIAKLVVADL
ncbi:MAG TPA: SGNH/GDSL hydrolase family protein [Acidimicrobiales bacterium]|nr:SGNH/GDSL hydrolase family protein [Acidimicrobiales bacterium]